MDHKDIQEVRRAMVWACSTLMWQVRGHDTLTARNITFHIERLLESMDDFYAGRDEPVDAE